MLNFTLLLLVSSCLSLTWCSVPTLQNVTVSCQNFKNVLYWNYSGPNLHPVFNVTIQEYTNGKVELLQTNTTFLDVSEFTQDIGETYSVKVEPELNRFENNSVGNIDFSYNKEFPVMYLCSVDFPTLNFSTQSHTIMFTFYNPNRLFGDDLEEDFSYSVRYNETETDFDCSIDDDWCTGKLNFYHSLMGHCINLHFEGSNLLTEVTKEVCVKRMEEFKLDLTTLCTAVVFSVIGLLIIAVLGVLIFKRLIQQDSHSPLLSKLLQGYRMEHAINVPEQPPLSAVLSVSNTNLLVIDPVSPTPSSPTTEEITHLPIHDISTSEDIEHGDMTEDEDSEGTNSFSGYDRSKFTIDMGQGDLVDAYGKRGL